MRIIQKKISLEPMTSRLPAMWPSYIGDKLYYFDEASLKARGYEYTSNYGMIPLNVGVNEIPNGDLTSGDYEVGCGFILSWYSFSKWYHFFTEYYNLLKHYGHCGRVYTSAEDYYNYESFEKYADQMIYGSDKQTYLDLDKEFYDKGGNALVTVYDKKKKETKQVTPEVAHDEYDGDGTAIIDVEDQGFFKWMCDNVVPTFSLPMDNRDYWKRDTLYYPDVLKWVGWFQDIEKSEECCDKEEYEKRGGKVLCDLMISWLKTVKVVDTLPSCDLKPTLEPMAILPIELQVSIDDLGEESIFSKEYELGKDYRTIETVTARNETTTVKYYNGNINTGTVAVIDDESFILTNDNLKDDELEGGFQFDSDVMEKYVSECEDCEFRGVFANTCPKCGSKNIIIYGWESYCKEYAKNNADEFELNANVYTFDNNDVKYFGSSEDDLREQLKTSYDIIKNERGWFYINGDLYDIEESEYGIYDPSNKYIGGKKFMVHRDRETMTPYTYVNGKEVYADFDISSKKYKFPFFPNQIYEMAKSINKMSYIRYASDIYEVVDGNRIMVETSDILLKESEEKEWLSLPQHNGTTSEFINANFAKFIKGYCITKTDDTLYVDENDKVYYVDSYSSTLKEYDAARVDGDKIVIEYQWELNIYSTKEITGRTTSKIYDLKAYNLLTDDVGNEIDGIYTADMKNTLNHQPPQGTILDPIYQVGNVANVRRFSLTTEDSSKDENYFIGDIITDMTFYYKDYDDNEVTATTVAVSLDEMGKVILYSGDSINFSSVTLGETTSLFAINTATELKKAVEDSFDCSEQRYWNDGTYTPSGDCFSFQNDIYCDITYCIGATLRREKGKPYVLSGDKNYGVRYAETVKFVKEPREYYLERPKKLKWVIPSERNNVSAHSLSYPIYVYVIKQDIERVENSQYDSDYSVAMADFITEINVFEMDEDKKNGHFSYESKDDMADRNNTEVYPTFREEYRLGISSMENIDSDIYIERGINAAFEKHLKLGEVTSLESLEQYGNNYFKIMDS